MSAVHIHHLQGAVSRIGEQETAYGRRAAPYLLNVIGTWPDPSATEQQVRWVREFWAALQPFSRGGTYVNFLGDEGQERVKAAYGANYQRLTALKQHYDPTNMFRFNQNVRPGAAA